MNIEQIASKEIFESPLIQGKWYVGGFSDDFDKDWYNLYSYEVLMETGEYVELKETLEYTQKVNPFNRPHADPALDFEDQNVMTKEDLFIFMLKFKFEHENISILKSIKNK